VATITFTSNLRRHVDCPAEEVPGDTVADCLLAYFAGHPNVRSYVLDEQGSVRRHVAVFVDGEQIRDLSRQTDPVSARGEITVMQALSGG
jgi:molybdopterin synthase sulfur carrier subunit